MPKPVLAVDVDGVIVNFHTSFFEFVNKEMGTNFKYEDCYSHKLEKVIGVSDDKFRDILDSFKETYGVDDHILIENAIESLIELEKHYKIISITGRQPNYKGVTNELFKKHAPFIDVYFAVGRNNVNSTESIIHKPQMAEKLGAKFLIDDNEHEFLEWDSKSVKPIIFAQPWNKALEKSRPNIPRMQWKGIKKYLMDDISKPVTL